MKNFNVWPSELFEWVEDFLLTSVKNRTLSLPHRWPDFANICKSTDKSMRDFFNIPDNYKIFYTYSATEWMEILIRNMVESKISLIVNWDFWELFVGESISLKKDVEIIKKSRWERVEINDINVHNDIMALTANDTSTGIAYSPEDLKNIRYKFSENVIIVDATSSFWALNYDINSADSWLFSVQKNFWLPPGLGIIIVNEKVIEKSLELEKKWLDVWWHHKLSSFLKFQETNHTPSTPNILLISALWFVVNKFIDVYWNIETLEKSTLEKSKYFYDNILLNVLCKNREWLSKTTFVLETTENQNKSIFKKLLDNWFSISPWYADKKMKNIRIANFPAHKLEDLKRLVEIINSYSL